MDNNEAFVISLAIIFLFLFAFALIVALTQPTTIILNSEGNVNFNFNNTIITKITNAKTNITITTPTFVFLILKG